MAHLEMHQFICRSDNYGLLVHDHRSGATASIDAPDAVEIERQLKKRGWQLTHILTTHHHGDHAGAGLLCGYAVVYAAFESDFGDDFTGGKNRMDAAFCDG